MTDLATLDFVGAPPGEEMRAVYFWVSPGANGLATISAWVDVSGLGDGGSPTIYTGDGTWIAVNPDTNVISHIGPGPAYEAHTFSFPRLAYSGTWSADGGISLQSATTGINFDAKGHMVSSSMGTLTGGGYIPQNLGHLGDVVDDASEGDILMKQGGVWKKKTPVTIEKVITAVRVSGLNWQTKSRANVVVLAAEDETDWTTFITGTDQCPTPS